MSDYYKKEAERRRDEIINNGVAKEGILKGIGEKEQKSKESEAILRCEAPKKDNFGLTHKTN